MRQSSRILTAKGLVIFSFLTLFSCSIPFLGKGRIAATDDHTQKLSTLSGVLEYREGCGPGYYKVVLKGLFEGAGIEIESQSDSLGKFTIKAPPGRYLAQVIKDQCGTKETVTLENNTEHMFSFVVQESRAIEKIGDAESRFPSRLPASVLVPTSAK